MAFNQEKNNNMSNILLGIITGLTVVSCYWQALPIMQTNGWTNQYVTAALNLFADMLSKPYQIKGLTFILLVCCAAVRTGKKREYAWKDILTYTAIGSLIHFLVPTNGILYTITSILGIGLSLHGFSLIFLRLKENEESLDDDGFEQNTELKENKNSVNIPFEFSWKQKIHKGWICFVNVFRATIVLGSPGSGKSFAVYNAFIEQTLRKGFTMFLYDYKFPDLTERVLTEISYQTRHEGLWQDMKKKPHLYIINFDDPMKTNRCNPIHHTYITDPADTTEIADLVFKNINKGVDGKGFDFFNESAKVYLDALVWYLANYDPDALYNDEKSIQWIREHRGQKAVDSISSRLLGNMDGLTVIGSKTNYINKGKYCTFPHVIELMQYNYRKTFQILQYTKGLEAKIGPFSSALEGGAMEQLQGQIASAQIPMAKFVSPAIYWVLSGNDFTLDINNPDDPKIVCMGNNPDRQTIYGTTLALCTSRMFKLINHKHKLKSVVLLDELPTIFLKGLDNLIATARSNKVAIVIGAQDKSQLRRDYGESESEVIFTTVGNLISGSVEGRTAKDISDAFGKEKKKKVSESIGEESISRSISYQYEDILPASKIVDMTQGTFCGWMKDDFGQRIRRKKFCGDIIVDLERNKKLEKEQQEVPVITQMFGENEPMMSPEDRERLEMIWPALKGDDKALQKKFLQEKTSEAIMENFNQIKKDVEILAEREYERTKVIAAKVAEQNKELDKNRG